MPFVWKNWCKLRFKLYHLSRTPVGNGWGRGVISDLQGYPRKQKMLYRELCKIDSKRNSFTDYVRLQIGCLVPLRREVATGLSIYPENQSGRPSMVRACARFSGGDQILPSPCRGATVSRPQSRTRWSTDKPSTCGGTRPAGAEARSWPLPSPIPAEQRAVVFCSSQSQMHAHAFHHK